MTADSSQSFENSWKHYLNIAQQAATTADGLAEKLLAQDLQIEQDKQAADEALADLCGDFSLVNQVTTSPSGVVTPTSDDSNLQACLNEPTVDVVFLGPPPSGLSSGLKQIISANPHASFWTASGADADWIRNNALNCMTVNTDPFCDQAKFPSLTFAALGIATPPPPPAPSTDCTQIAGIANSLHTNFAATALTTFLGGSVASASAMTDLVNNIRLIVGLDDSWRVLYGPATVLMDSTDTTQWPGCLKLPQGCSGANDLIQTLNAMYRWCPKMTSAAQLLSTSLGCDPAPGDPTPDQGELNILKWRVMGSLMLVASAAGKAPANMFNIPIPVATWPPMSSTTSLWVAATYPGTLVSQSSSLVSGLPQWTLGSTTAADIQDIAPMYGVPAAFQSWPKSAGLEVPGYYTDLYAASTRALLTHKAQANAAFVFPHCQALARAGESRPCTDSPQLFKADWYSASNPLSLSLIFDTAAPTLQGAGCSSPGGHLDSPVSEPAAAKYLVDMVTQAKEEHASPNYIVVTNDQQDTHIVSNFAYCYSSGPSLWGPNGGSCPSWDNPTFLDLAVHAFNGFRIGPPEAPTFFQFTTFNGGYNGMGAHEFSPRDRVAAFVNSGGANDVCGALPQVLQAAGLACAAQEAVFAANSAITSSAKPPPVATVGDIARLEGWLSTQSTNVAASVGKLYAELVPVRVLGDFQTGRVGSGSKAGQHGANVLQMESALSSVPAEWTQIATDLQGVGNAIQAARIALAGADLQATTTLGQLALQRIHAEATMARAPRLSSRQWLRPLAGQSVRSVCHS